MWGKIVSSVSSALDFNQATLSGSIDVIVVQEEDGGYKSTPFHVRFGKAKLLRSREKIVSITVNDTPRPLTMTLGPAGEAYFAHQVEDMSLDEHECSPLLGENDSPPLPDFTELSLSGIEVDDADAGEVSKSAEPVTHRSDDERRSLPIPAAEDTGNGERSDIYSSPVEFSFCGHLLYGFSSDTQHDKDVFESNIATWETLDRDPTLWYHPSLVARFDGAPPYYPGKVALPLLASWNVFNLPLSLDAVRSLMTTNVTAECVESKSWLEWIQSPSSPRRLDVEPTTSESVPPLAGDVTSEGYTLDTVVVDGDGNGPLAPHSSRTRATAPRIRKSLRPTSEELDSLGLKTGSNKVTFTVTSALQGIKTVAGTIYLWPSTSRIVVSDVDGTITRSDVLGQLMPIVGRDWSHAGVADLFSRIRANGYQLLYLTARAIGQADSTRDYLFGLTQNGQAKLPDGPLICSPDRLFPSFKREVIDRKPYVFKIAALRDIRKLFPSHYNPFYAGFGNRDTDHRAYVHLGIPEAKVFIIDKMGTIHHLNKNYAKTYDSLAEITEEMFPAREAIPDSAEDDKVRSRKRLCYQPTTAFGVELEDKVIQAPKWCCAPRRA